MIEELSIHADRVKTLDNVGDFKLKINTFLNY